MGTITLNERVIICKPLMVDGYYHFEKKVIICKPLMVDGYYHFEPKGYHL